MTPSEFLQTPMTDEQFEMHLDWESKGKPVDHPFIWEIMTKYKEL